MTSKRILKKSLYLSSYRMSYPSYKSSSAPAQTSELALNLHFAQLMLRYYKCTHCFCCVCNPLNFTHWSSVLPGGGWYLGDIWKILTAEFYQPCASLFRTSNSTQAWGSISKITAHNDNLLEKYQELGNIKNSHMTMLPFRFLKKEFLGFHLIYLFFPLETGRVSCSPGSLILKFLM